MKTLIGAAALAFSVVASPAMATSYDVVVDFGNPVFSYGTGSGATAFTSAPLKANCFGNAALSCYANNADSAPTVLKNNSMTAQSIGTPTVPVDALLLHPDSSTTSPSDAVLSFTSATGGDYSLAGAFSRLDTSSGSGNGVDVSIFSVSGVTTTSLFSGVIGSSDYAPLAFSDLVSLAAGGKIIFVVNNAGEYTFDSTGLRATISAVPEPTTWAMMLAGFGMIGFAARRRGNVKTTVRFA